MEGVITATLLAGVMLLSGSGVALAHGVHHQAAPAATAAAARVTLHDIQLVDVDGQSVRFKSEAVANRLVIIGFIYTSCTTICPVTSTVLADVQARLTAKLGARFGDEIKLICVTVDPATDTPERLKAYAANFGAPSGWLWLTGERPQVNKVLSGLGAYAADFTRHSGAILVGDARSGDWLRFPGLANPADIVDRVEKLLAARTASGFEDRR